jgi:tungstate transport system substrate-binding protein
MKNLKKWLVLLMAIIMTLAFVGCQQQPAAQDPENGDVENGDAVTEYADSIILATTTSTYDSGLLDVLLPVFKEKYDIEVDVVSVGTGQAIEIGQRGDCDVILVHSRALEDQFVEEGYGTERWDVMYNDFVYLGPAGDPGEIKDSADLKTALEKMVAHMESANLSFTSRGDNSGTHNKESKLWEEVGIETEGQEWYLSLGQGMGDTLIATNEMECYTMTDRGTYLAMKDNLPNLEIVFEGDDNLFNPYGIIPVNPEKHADVHFDEAMLLVNFMISDEIQEMIGEFGKDKFGQPLFFPNAK